MGLWPLLEEQEELLSRLFACTFGKEEVFTQDILQSW